MMTKQRLKEIEARANLATKGVWLHTFDQDNHELGNVWGPDGDAIAERVHGNLALGGDGIDNAAFIAHAREDVPALFAEVRRLQQRLKNVPEQTAFDKDGKVAAAMIIQRLTDERDAALAERDAAQEELSRTQDRADGYRAEIDILLHGRAEHVAYIERLTAERDVALQRAEKLKTDANLHQLNAEEWSEVAGEWKQRAEQAEVTVALLRDFTTRERALRDAVGKGGQHVGYGPSINPTTLRELERMITDAPSTADWLGKQVKATQQQRDAALAERDDAQTRLRGLAESLQAAGHEDLASVFRVTAERDAALSERDALRELLNVYNIGGWTDALAPMQRALKAEAALTEARQVLRDTLAELAPFKPCGHCGDEETGEHDELCDLCDYETITARIAAVLAQEEK